MRLLTELPNRVIKGVSKNYDSKAGLDMYICHPPAKLKCVSLLSHISSVNLALVPVSNALILTSMYNHIQYDSTHVVVKTPRRWGARERVVCSGPA